jgi:hypothetical protein
MIYFVQAADGGAGGGAMKSRARTHPPAWTSGLRPGGSVQDPVPTG